MPWATGPPPATGILGRGGVRVPGGPRGLQNRREGDELSGGFDSRPPPRGKRTGRDRGVRRLHILFETSLVSGADASDPVREGRFPDSIDRQ
jgi:hypothetical protein